MGVCVECRGAEEKCPLQLLRAGEVVLVHSVWAEVCQMSKGTFPEDDMCINPEASEVQIF